MQATKQQIIAVNTILSKRGLMEDKASIISGATNERTTHSSELTFQEAQELIEQLNDGNQDAKDKMIRRMVAMCYDLNWIKEKQVVGKKGLTTKKDYSSLYAWVEKYGYLGKPLNQYKYEELPKLVTQFMNGPYAHYLKK